MTDGEKMVWAAVYARELRKAMDLGPPRDVIHDGDKWEQWERGQATTAIECAWGAVALMRESVPNVHAGFGADSDVSTHLAEMLAP